MYEYPDRLRLKSKIRPRFTMLPLTPWTFFERIPTVKSINHLISLRGTVIRSGLVKMQEMFKEWECTRCKTRQKTFSDDYQYGTIPKPVKCTGSLDDITCKNVKFTEIAQLSGSGVHEDYQEIKVQELTNVLGIGAVPRSIFVILRYELVDKCRAGDDILITGILGCRWKPFREGSKMEGELFLQASSLQLTSNVTDSSLTVKHDQDQRVNFKAFWAAHPVGNGEKQWNARSIIVNSFCAQIHGMFLVKLATLMTVIGGSDYDQVVDADLDPNFIFNKPASTVFPKMAEGGARRSRREGHILLVGDPGTGKSQFLVNAAKLIDRSVMTTGSGSTSAGLTVAAVKDGGDWQLEAGALVMADRGVCCIDEFNALKPQDRTAIHEAMEQQTISVAKAGLVCKLNTRCSIIAACNAKGEIEAGKSISSSVALASPLLSRFDLILLLLDAKRTNKEAWDLKLCDKVLNSGRSDLVVDNKNWDFDVLKEYVNFVRVNFQPEMTSAANDCLSKYYQLQRRVDSLHCARTTVRMLESLVRMSQAHAKLMFRNEVTLRDAISSIILMEASLTTTQTVSQNIDLYSEHDVENYEQIYKEIEGELLKKLGLEHLLLCEAVTDAEGSQTQAKTQTQYQRDVEDNEDLSLLLNLNDNEDFSFLSEELVFED